MTMIAFQGGGARLVDLLAVAKAVHNLKFPYTKVAGTSAGSIAAAVLASGKDPELLRNYFIANEGDIRRKFPKIEGGLLGYWRSARHLYRAIAGGQSFVDKDLMPWLVANGMKVLGYTGAAQINELKRAPLKIVAADLRAKKPKIYSDKDSLIDSIVRSCSVPLIFSSYTGTEPHIVDGALFSNLPVDALLGDATDKEEVIAISFTQEYAFAPENMMDYFGEMASSMIDARTLESALVLGEENVMRLDTKIRSFSLDDFFANLKGSYFQQCVDQASRWLVAWRRKQNAQYNDFRSLHSHAPAYVGYLTSKLHQLETMLQPDSQRVFVHLDFLIEPSINGGDDDYDLVTTSITLESDPNHPQTCFSCSTTRDTDNHKHISADWQVFDADGNLVPHVALPIEMPAEDKTKTLVIFGKALGGPGGHDKSYRIVQRQIIQNYMKQLRDGDVDYYYVKADNDETLNRLTIRLETSNGLFGKVRQWPENDDTPGRALPSTSSGATTTLCWEAIDLKPGAIVRINYQRK